MQKIGFIGVGNMGGALASAVAAANTAPKLYLSDHNQDKVAQKAAELQAQITDNGTVASTCDCIFLGVKPQMLSAVMTDLQDALKKNPDPLLVSMAAGVSLSTLEKLAGENTPIIRIMPNTPVAVGKGMILYTPNKAVTPEKEAAFLTIMEKAGVLDRIDEEVMDAASAVSGCGPAFVYMFIEALASGGVNAGLSWEKAVRYAAQTAAGAAELLMQSGEHPKALKEAVCSPAGSTIEGVGVLEQRGMPEIVSAAVKASFQRTQELGKQK